MKPTLGTARLHAMAVAYSGLAQSAMQAGSYARAAMYADMSRDKWVQVMWED